MHGAVHSMPAMYSQEFLLAALARDRKPGESRRQQALRLGIAPATLDMWSWEYNKEMRIWSKERLVKALNLPPVDA